MTTHAHGSRSTIAGRFGGLNRRQRWALVGIPVALVAGLLVLAGVVSPSTVLYAGAFGGMMLMHLGGHGSHGGHGEPQAGPAPNPPAQTQPDDASSTGEPEPATGPGPTAGVVEDRIGDAPDPMQERGSHSCH